MKRVLIGLFALATAVSAASVAHADNDATFRSAARLPVFMRVYGSAQPPYGFVRFCDTQPNFCRASPGREARFQATPERLSELDEINRSVNAAIAPETDVEIYGTSEHWAMPRDRGDCEDYALLKRHLLMERGWPSGSLLMTVVRDEKGEGHAVLTARTTQGDFVLDNKVEDVRVWNRTPYEFVMRQSYLNPKVWVSLDPMAGQLTTAISGFRAEPE